MSKKIDDINNILNTMIDISNWKTTRTYQEIEHYLKQESGLSVHLESRYENLIAFHLDISLIFSSIMQGRKRVFQEQSQCILFITRCQVDRSALSAYLTNIVDQIRKTLTRMGGLEQSHLIYVIDDHNDVRTYFQDMFSHFFISGRDGLKSMMLSSYTNEYIHDRLRSKSINLSHCPFNYLGPINPKLFVGRTELRQEIINSQSVYAYAIAGGRKIGKSSLLFKIMLDIKSSGSKGKLYPIYIDCSNSSSYETLIDEIYRKLNPDSKTIPDVNLESLLSRGYKGKPIMLLLDEMDAFIQNVRTSGDDSHTFESAIRAITNKKRAKVVICGNREVLDLITDSKHPYHNVFDRKQLGVLSFEEIRQLIILPFRELLFEIENPNELVQQIFNKTSGHPSAVQFIARSLFDMSDKKSIRLEYLSKIFEHADLIDFIDDIFVINTTSIERLICLLTIEKDSFTIDDVLIAFEDYNIQMNDPWKKVKIELNHLQFNNVLKKEGKFYSFLYPLMKQIIKDYLVSPYLIKVLVAEVAN